MSILAFMIIPDGIDNSGEKIKENHISASKPLSYASEPSKTKNYSLTPFKYILGEKLLHYNVYGFNDYEFRTHFDEFDFNIASNNYYTQLTKDRYFENGTRFIFNSNKELIGITKNYQGNPENLIDSIIEKFGNTNQKVMYHREIQDNNVLDWSIINYHFPKVYVRIISSKRKTVRQFSTDIGGWTEIQLTDLEWLKKHIAITYEIRRKRFLWLLEILKGIRNGSVNEIKISDDDVIITKIDLNSNHGDYRVAEFFKYEDYDSEFHLKDKNSKRTFAIIAWKKDNSSKNIPFALWQFGESPIDTYNDILFQEQAQNHWKYRGTPICFSFAAQLMNKLNSAAAQNIFPPKGKSITTRSNGDIVKSHEWKSTDNWKVKLLLEILLKYVQTPYSTYIMKIQ